MTRVLTKTTSKKKTAKKATTRKATTRKATTRKAAATKATTPRTASAARVAEIRIAKDGGRWTLLLEGGARLAVAASAAQAAGVRIGARWTDALAARVARASDEQQLVTRAMGLLAKGFAGDRAALREALGGDATATRAVRSLADNGWIR